MINNFFIDNSNRIIIIKSLSEARDELRKTNSFINTSIYCISRCMLQDCISFIEKNKLNNADNIIVKKFYSKYKDTRDVHSHMYASNKVEETLTLLDITNIFDELCKEYSANMDIDSNIGLKNFIKEQLTNEP